MMRIEAVGMYGGARDEVSRQRPILDITQRQHVLVEDASMAYTRPTHY
jgi:hypothetical protein